MSMQPVQDTARGTPQAVLDAVISAAHAGGRPDIAERLSGTRRLLVGGSVTVQVAGGAQQDRTALVSPLRGDTQPQSGDVRVRRPDDGADPARASRA
jgi:hypothetical protein